MEQLGIELIVCDSPQLRGRCERLFGTWQGRLPRELHLEGITDLAAANRHLEEQFILYHNQHLRYQRGRGKPRKEGTEEGRREEGGYVLRGHGRSGPGVPEESVPSSLEFQRSLSLSGLSGLSGPEESVPIRVSGGARMDVLACTIEGTQASDRLEQ